MYRDPENPIFQFVFILTFSVLERGQVLVLELMSPVMKKIERDWKHNFNFRL